MALTPLEALNKVVEDTVVDLRLVGARTLANLNDAGCVQDITKTQLNWDVVVGGAGVAWESMEADGADTPTDDTVPATLSVGQYRVKHQFSVSRVAIKEAATLAPDDLKDIFGEKIQSGLIKLVREVNRVIWLGDGTPAMGEVVGIQKVLDNTYSYAGVNPATYPGWKAPQLANAGTARALTRPLILDYEEMLTNSESFYNYVTCNPATGKAYTALFDNLAGAAALPNGREQFNAAKVDLGHGNRYFRGMPLVEDPICPVGQLVTMRLDPTVIRLKTFNLGTKLDGEETEQVVSSKTMGLNVHLSRLPSNNSAKYRFEMYAMVQMQVKDRRAVQAIRDLL